MIVHLKQGRKHLLVKWQGLVCGPLCFHLILDIKLTASSIDVYVGKLHVPAAEIPLVNLVADVEEKNDRATKI
jgi:hypothetical protein